MYFGKEVCSAKHPEDGRGDHLDVRGGYVSNIFPPFLGNHEFDDGIPGLVPYIKAVSTPIVCSNLNISQVPELKLPKLTPSVVLTVNGTKIGVIGYLTPETKCFSDIELILEYEIEAAKFLATEKQRQVFGIYFN
ncbi:hypothetical protein J6590_000059 [Homalodisca vitripennis]|nr:hypothetical protein J6590_000059 [Homalodisca vitripennis]